MRIKRKTEEKKMSMSKNIARLAVTAGLTAALSFGGVMAPVTMAFADGATATTNSITIKKKNDQKKVKAAVCPSCGKIELYTDIPSGEKE